MMNIKFMILLVIFGMCVSLNLQPDVTNPVMMYLPILSSKGQQIDFRFSFPSGRTSRNGGTSGITLGQFIGIQFPVNVGNELFSNNNQGGMIYHNCTLTDGTYNYVVTPVQSVSSPINSNLVSESFISYCRLDDTSVLVPISADPSKIYKLTLGLLGTRFSSNFIRAISLFTSTSNNPDKMIIDSIPVIGNLAIYGGLDNISFKPLAVTSPDIKVLQGPSAFKSESIIYPFNTFDLTINIISNSFIYAADSIIVFKYPNMAITGPTDVASLAIQPNDPLQVALKGVLKLKPFGTDGIYLDGWEEDLTPNRQFKLSLRGWKSLQNTEGFDPDLKTYVFYKNTYSILSYDRVSIFSISQALVTLTANHPEYWDVYQSGAWPIAFKFTTNTDLVNGGWVLIQQINTLGRTATVGNKVSFIASTCDFSQNDVTFDNSFGKRPNCYPLRNDQPQTIVASTPNESNGNSGVFFFMKGPIIGNKTYMATIWAFFDICSGSSPDAYDVVNKTALTNVSPTFRLLIYTNINSSQMNEDRFRPINGRNQIIAKSKDTAYAGLCWNNYMYENGAALNTNLKDMKVNLTPENTITGSNSILYYKEISDWNIYRIQSDTSATNIANGFFENTNISNIQSGTPPLSSAKYFFSTSNALGKDSYFLVYFKLPNMVAPAELWKIIPTPLMANYKAAPGKIIYQFSSAWFTAGNGYKFARDSPNPTCFASWTLSTQNKNNQGVINKGNDVMRILPGFNATGKLVYNGNASKMNFFGAATTDGSTFDGDNTLLPPDNTREGSANIMRLVSSYTGGEDSSSSKFIFWGYSNLVRGVVGVGDYAQAAFYTSCVKWTSTVPSITSLFTYIDIQIKFNYISTGDQIGQKGTGVTISNIRMIKLFPESGVFNDFDKNSTNAPLTNPFINHVAYTAIGRDSICLLELSGASLAQQKDPWSNTLVVWLFGGVLIETDYNDLSATYPAAPLVSGVLSYGLSSGTMGYSNPYLTSVGTFIPLTNIFVNLNRSKSLSNDNDIPSGFRNNSTNYIFFMGSVLLFTSVITDNLTNTTTEKSLYIPYYCPKYNSSINGNSTLGATFYPTIIAGWVTMSAHNSISTLNKYITYKDSVSFNANSAPNYTVLGSRINSVSETVVDITKAYVTEGAKIYPATLRWSPYTSADQFLYVYNGTLIGPGEANIFCTGSSLFLEKNISIEDTVDYKAGYSGSIGVYNQSKLFYVFGKPFNKAVFYGYSNAAYFVSPNMAPVQTLGDSISTNYYIGIKRPSVDSFISNGNLVLTDKVAFSCVSATRYVNTVLTNYVLYSYTGSTVSYFILDWYPKLYNNRFDWNGSSISFDKPDVYKNDPAGNAKLFFQPPQTIPAGSQLRFTFAGNAATRSTICGIIITNNGFLNFAKQCTSVSDLISCEVPYTGYSFTVCCYNLYITDPLALKSAVAYFPPDPNVNGLISWINGDIYGAAEQIQSANPFMFVTANSSALDLIGTKSAFISAISYSQVKQERGIGKATFIVTLPREPTRDMRLSIEGDLSDMFIPGNIPRCHASFSDGLYGYDFDNGDALIESCATSKISQATQLVITTKKLIYKCGLTFSKTLYINLWPVIVINWANSNKTFRVTMRLNSNEAIALNNYSFSMPFATILGRVEYAGQWDSLCTVTGIIPRIPGEVADYTFEFDLDTNKYVLPNSYLNEISIFFPYQYYGSFIPNVMCYYNGIYLNCSFTDEGILNIRFTDILTGGPGKKVPITVVGIMNPAIDSDISFPCTLNNTNFGSGIRTNIITGSGKLGGGITTSSYTMMGSLRFLSVTNPISDRNPRYTSTHKFRITLENIVPLFTNSPPITITNSPIIYINFPINYALGLNKTKPSASIDEYISDDTNRQIKKSTTISSASVAVSGNRVTIKLNIPSYIFGSNFRYWDIILTNIVNPSENTGTTRPYSITLTNSITTVLYRTYTNVNTLATDLLANAVDSWLVYNRGISFNFDDSKWVVDIYWDNIYQSQLNLLIIRPGRFLSAFFKIKTNTKIVVPSATTITLTDLKFQTLNSSYILSTSLMGPMQFYIGCTCGTPPGSYILNFSSSEKFKFAPLSPVMVTVDSTIGTIRMEAPTNVAPGGSAFIRFYLSDINFDPLSINWLGQDNDVSAKITNVMIPPATRTVSGLASPVISVFSITSMNVTANQVFNTIDPNSCYSFRGENVVSFTISGKIPPTIPNNFSTLRYHFFFSNSSTGQIGKNSIKFEFLPPFAPIYIYCALNCLNRDYPADVDIVDTKIPNSNYTRYYRNFIDNTSSYLIFFFELVRVQTYRMKCIIETTEADSAKRTRYSVDLRNYTTSTECTARVANTDLWTCTSNNCKASVTNTDVIPDLDKKSISWACTSKENSTVNIIPEATPATQCALFQFLSDPGESTKKSIVNYCQRIFSVPGWLMNGCVVCSDSDMNYLVPGMSMQLLTCEASGKSVLRFLQAEVPNVGKYNSTITNLSTFSVCPVPDPSCSTDVNAASKQYKDYFAQFINDLKSGNLFKQNLNIDNIILNSTYPILTYNDSVAVDMDKIKANITSFNINGSFSFTLTSELPVPLKCFYQILESGIGNPQNLFKCIDIYRCGYTKVPMYTTVTVSQINIKDFYVGTIYSLYVGCSNDIPMSQLLSSTKLIYSFSFSAPPVTSTNITTDGDSTVIPSVVPSVVTTSGYYHQISIILYLIFIIL